MSYGWAINELLSRSYEIATALKYLRHTDEMISRPYEIATVALSYEWVTDIISQLSHADELLSHPYEITRGWKNM